MAIEMHKGFIKTSERINEGDVVIDMNIIAIPHEQLVSRCCDSQAEVSCVSIKDRLSLFDE